MGGTSLLSSNFNFAESYSPPWEGLGEAYFFAESYSPPWEGVGEANFLFLKIYDKNLVFGNINRSMFGSHC